MPCRERRRWLSGTAAGLLLGLALLPLGGCGVVYKSTGRVLTGYSEDELVPYVLASRDTAMACATGESLSHLLLSFGRLNAPPNKAGSQALLLAGLCAEARAIEAHLRYLRALDQGRSAEARDARVVEKRAQATAARRRLASYRMVTAEYGEPGGACPELATRDDQLYWLLGLVTGVQAVLSDVRAELIAGVPRDVAIKAARGARCLDDERWWGVPLALRAAVWTTVPGSRPEGESPWRAFREATEIADRTGVRLAYTLQAVAAENSGRARILRDAIRGLARARTERAPAGRYRLIDEIAADQVRAISDRMWTEATGHRTPAGELGTFWDDRRRDGVDDLDRFLSGPRDAGTTGCGDKSGRRPSCAESQAN